MIVVASALLLIPLLSWGAYKVLHSTNSKVKEQMINLNNTNPIKFNQAAWKNPKPKTGIRQQMVNNLLFHHPLVGMERDKVIKLLGPLESTWGFDNAEEGYHLNERDSAGSMWLKLHFQDDVVDSQTIWHFDP